jgi:hypothetical protein
MNNLYKWLPLWRRKQVLVGQRKKKTKATKKNSVEAYGKPNIFSTYYLLFYVLALTLKQI